VLSRFYYAAKENNLDTLVRVTSDCPLIDGSIIKYALEKHLSKNDENLYTSNVLERTYPRGLDFEIFSFKRLATAFEKAKEDFQREHVTPYINRNADGKTLFEHIRSAHDRSDWRLTVDTPDDYKLIQILIEEFGIHKLTFEEMVPVLDVNSALRKINDHIEQKKI
jgi:spore coat polysaccharide biosynthesis protein SpsF